MSKFQDIVDFIKGAGQAGFIYVSFGSGANIADAPFELQNTFYTAFRKSKIRFLWKWDGARPAEMPPNVMTAEWMPQQEILGTVVKHVKNVVFNQKYSAIYKLIFFQKH